MKKFKRHCVFTIIIFQTLILSAQNGVRDSIFNFDWKFQKGNFEEAQEISFDDSNWRTLDIPHDWSIEDLNNTDSSSERRISGPFDSDAISGHRSGYTVGGIAWYRKHFTISSSDTGKVVYINFDGIYMNSEIWLNGNLLGKQPYGYSAFNFDISKHLNYGNVENVIAVKVKNEGENCRWYSGSGIYRNVTLSIVEKVHIIPWGIFVSTPKVNKQQSTVRVKAEIANYYQNKKDIDFHVVIRDMQNKLISEKEISSRIHSNISAKLTLDLKIDNPELWSPNFPNMYKLECYTISNGRIEDKYETTFGIRSFEFDSEKGMFLNGEKIKLKGGSVHSNNGPLGAAAYGKAEERRVQILKDAGFNAVRCGHNPPSTEFLNVCDRIGLLVIDEAFDDWMAGSLESDYKLYFNDWWKHDLTNMILRDRNHPSIFTWSIGNQIRNAQDSLAVATAHKLANHARLLDPTRVVTANIAMMIKDNWLDGSPELWKNYDPIFEALDICGYSYQSSQYENVHKRLPDRIQFSTEINPKHCFRNWMRAIDNDYIIGNFAWTAMDYMGEASSGWLGYYSLPNVFPWHTAFTGDIDLCGFRKPRSYYRDILFNNGKQISVFVHSPVSSFEGKNVSLWGWDDVKPSWTWPGFENDTMQVDVYSAYEQVELFLNDSSLGMKASSRNTEFKTSWNVAYAAGNLKAVGTNSDGSTENDILKTTGRPYGIRLSAESRVIKADRQDLCFIIVEVVDKNNKRVPYAQNDIRFSIEGEGQLAAAGNGNPTSLESFQKPIRKAYEGKCLLIVKSNDKEGYIKVKAESQGLKSNAIKIRTKNNN